MDWKIVGLVLLAASCAQGTESPVEVRYNSYDDCILGKLGRGQSTVASEALIAACRSKFPKDGWEVVSRTPAGVVQNSGKSKQAGLFDDLIPARRTRPNWWEASPLARDSEPAPPTRGTFHGYRCTDDCSGHRAGYAWAGRLQLQAASSCGGNSQSFIEGCWAWVREHGN